MNVVKIVFSQQDTQGVGNVVSSSTRMKSLSETEGASSSSSGRSSIPTNASSIPVGLGSGGLQHKVSTFVQNIFFLIILFLFLFTYMLKLPSNVILEATLANKIRGCW